MNIKQAEDAVKLIKEVSENKKDNCQQAKATNRTVADTKKLWKEGNKSNLAKIGVACLLFPDPTPVTPILGAGLLTAAAIQKGIKNQGIYLDDIKKTYQKTLKEIQAAKLNMRL